MILKIRVRNQSYKQQNMEYIIDSSQIQQTDLVLEKILASIKAMTIELTGSETTPVQIHVEITHSKGKTMWTSYSFRVVDRERTTRSITGLITKAAEYV